MVQYRTHTTKTLNYPSYYLEELRGTKDVFTTYWTSLDTDSIAHACMKDLTMQLKAEPAIEDEETAEHSNSISCTQQDHR